MMASAQGMTVVMTVDAVGGVWRYAMDLARRLRVKGASIVFLGFGPKPDEARTTEARRIGTLDWSDAPLDWMAESAAEVAAVASSIAATVQRCGADLVHLNLPSQGAGLDLPIPIVVVSHSCVVTWFRAVRGTQPPEAWHWQADHNRRGFAAARAVVAPSQAHAALLRRCYGPLQNLQVVWNGSDATIAAVAPDPASAVAVGRWWDDGKNPGVLDAAAALLPVAVRMIGATRSPSGHEVALRHAESLGELGRSDTLARLASCGIFIAPSIYEPFGLAVLEAARAARPLVLADIATFRELWDGAALFFPADSPQALARAVLTLVEDRELAVRLGAAARERAARYTLDRQAEAMIALYVRSCRSSEPALVGR